MSNTAHRKAMIRFHLSNTDRPQDGGYFSVDGSRKVSTDYALQLFTQGAKADRESRRILAQWVSQAKQEAESNQRQWNQFCNANPQIAACGI